MTNIKPIETVYKGYRFRSRLEARWAVFFDEIGLPWEYESEGYTLPDGRGYLPDFRIKSLDGATWFYEVKPTHEADDGKLAALIDMLEGDERKRGIPCYTCQEAADYESTPTDAPPCVKCPHGFTNVIRYVEYPTVFGRVLTGDPYHFVIEMLNYPCPRCMQFTLPEGDLSPLGGPCGCEPCDWNTPSGGGHPPENHFGFDVFPHKGEVCFKDRNAAKKYKRLVDRACRSARSARFEHGENWRRRT